MGKTIINIINHPFGNGSYHLFMVIWGMVCYCFTHIMKLCSFGVYHVAPFTTTIGSITCSTIFHPAEVQTLCCRPDSKSRCARKWAEMVCHFQGETSSASIKGLLWTSFKEILFLINPVQKRKSLGKSASSLQLPWLLSTTSRTLWFSGCDRIAFW